MDESPYDAFGGGHSSVSISAAFGMAKAAELRGERRQVVAVIGDGAMTGGLAFEGLNNAGASKRTNLLVILNDNNMAIDQATGALKNYLLKISTSVRYNRLKRRVWRAFSHVPPLLHLCQKTGNAVKQGLLKNSNLFESLNFRYFGPVDGHNLKELVRVLAALRDIDGPKLLHVMTVKGKGYLPAEHDQSVWHAPGKFDPSTGRRLSGGAGAARYQDVFGETLVELARQDPRVVGITPAMPSGCSMNLLMREMPDRCFDVGIAEGHAVTFSAGLAAAGMRPFCNIYSTFMQRAYDNVIHDVALQRLPVVLCLDRGGLVGEDGATHHGAFDLAYFGPIPNLIVAAPMDEAELRNLLYTALLTEQPFVIRYPRGPGCGGVLAGHTFRATAPGPGPPPARRPRRGRTEHRHDRQLRRRSRRTGRSGGAERGPLRPALLQAPRPGAAPRGRPLVPQRGDRRGRRSLRRRRTGRHGLLQCTRLSGSGTLAGHRRYVRRTRHADELYALCGYDAEGIYHALKSFR